MKKLFAIFALAFSIGAGANTLTINVPFPPGGATDVWSRTVSRYLQDQLNRDVVVVNRPAADGRLVMEQVHQNASGNELITAATGPFLFNKIMFKKVSTDYNDFDLVAPLVRVPTVFSTSVASGVNSWKDLVALSRTRFVNCAGSSASSVFVGKYIFQQLGIVNVTWVPFKGSADMNQQLAAGNIDCGFDTSLAALPLHRAGKFKIIAVGNRTRWSVVPEAALFSDAVPGLTFNNWYGMGMSKSAPAADRERILTVLRKINNDPGYREALERAGLEAVTAPPNGSEWIHAEYVRFEALRRSLGIEQLD